MVVHGRNKPARDALFDFLRSIGLLPIEWSAAAKATNKGAPYVREILDVAFRQAAAVVVLLTPDDEARLKRKFRKASDPSYERNLTGQARPNVLFEAGRAFGSHPDSTIVVQIGSVRPFTDTAGLHIIHLSNTPEARNDLANRLEAAGCAVNRDGTDWLTPSGGGDFDVAY
jgi:predicted nucleotide-binding protein